MTALQTQIDAEIAKRRQEIEALETARAVLNPNGVRGRYGGALPKNRRMTITRAPRGARKEQVLAALTDKPQGPSAIAKTVGMTPQHAASVLKQLGEAKSARKLKRGWVKVNG